MPRPLISNRAGKALHLQWDKKVIMTRTRIFLLYLLVLLFAAFIHSPALHAPWQGGELELFDDPVYPLKNMSALEIFERAPGEFLGYWTLALQAKYAPYPFGFRLVNLILIIFSLSMIFFLLLIMTKTAREHPLLLLFIFSLVALHPYITELISRAETRSALVALLFSSLSAVLLYTGLKEDAGKPMVFIFAGIISFLIALSAHFGSIIILLFIYLPQYYSYNQEFSLNSARSLKAGVTLLLISLIYLIVALSQVSGSYRTFSETGHGLEYVFGIISTGNYPVEIPVKAGSYMISWVGFISYGLILILYAVFLADVNVPRRTSSRKASERVVFFLIYFISIIVGVRSVILYMSTACLMGLLLFACFIFVIYKLILSYGYFGSYKKTGVVIFSVILILIFGASSLNRADFKQPDLLTARHSVRVDPENGLAWLGLANSYLSHSRPDLSDAVLQKSQAELFPDVEKSILFKIELAKGNLIVARGMLEEYLAENLDEETVKLYECQLSVKEGNIEEAEKSCGHDFSDPTMQAAALNQLGGLYLKSGKEEEGEELLKRSHDLDRFYPGALNNLGFIEERRENIDRALGYYLQAARIDPFSIVARKNAARLLAQKDEYAESARMLREAVRINPNEADARARLAITLILKLERPEEARPHLLEALRLAPDHPVAEELKRLGEYYGFLDR